MPGIRGKGEHQTVKDRLWAGMKDGKPYSVTQAQALLGFEFSRSQVQKAIVDLRAIGWLERLATRNGYREYLYRKADSRGVQGADGVFPGEAV